MGDQFTSENSAGTSTNEHQAILEPTPECSAPSRSPRTPVHLHDAHHFAEKRRTMHYLRKPEGFTTGLSWGNLSYQMQYSIETLEDQLAAEGSPHVLQLNLDWPEDDWRNPTAWHLYADGFKVAYGSGLFARQCFEESAERFRDACREVVLKAELDPLSEREYWLLSRARAIAAVEPFDNGHNVRGERVGRV